MASTEKGNLVVDVVSKAISSLLKWRKLHSRKPLQLSNSLSADAEEESFEEAGDINDGDDFIYLLLTLKRVPPPEFSQIPHKITLPYPIHSFTHQSFNLCLIIDDRPTKSPHKITSEDALKRIKAQDVPISKVLKLSKIKSDYASFEKRRHLYQSFDMFFADKRLIPLLPKYLGKQFYKKKRKVPVPVDLRNSSNWKEQIEGACGSALLCLGSGTCSVLRIGNCGVRNGMGKDQIVENVLAAIKGLVEIVPRKWGGVKALHLKLSDSLSLPIFEAGPGSGIEIDGVVKEKGLRGT